MSTKKVPVPQGPAAGSEEPREFNVRALETKLSGATIDQISMKDLERLKARSRELMGLIIAAQHRS